MVSMQECVRHNRLCSIGALHLSVDTILASIAVFLLLGIAAINDTCLISVAVILPVLLVTAHYLCTAYLPQSRFFFAWALCSIVYLWIIFEITVPLLELLPEENFIFRMCIFGSIFCFYRVGACNANSTRRCAARLLSHRDPPQP